MSRTVIAGTLLALLLATRTGEAFDTSHHWDMTRNALMREGFSDEAINVVILQNWLTDFYSSYDAKWILRQAIRTGEEATVRNAVQLHFDNLTSTEAVTKYWDTLVATTASQLFRIARRKQDDPLEVLTVLGITLHAVQDFYTHSNWVTDDTRTCMTDQFSAVTWLDAKRANTMPTRPIFTGTFPEGGPRSHERLNKDSIARPCWAEAYVLAYKATRQWIRAFAAFIDQHDGNRDLWQRCVRGVLVRGGDATALAEGLDASQRISILVAKWQGGSLLQMGSGLTVETFMRFRKSVSAYKRELLEGKTLSELAANLRAGEAVGPFQFDAPVFQTAPDDEHIFFLRVDGITSTNQASPAVLPHEDRFFVKTTLTAETTDNTIFRQEFRSLTDAGNFGQREPPWRIIWFVPRTAGTVEAMVQARNDGPAATIQVPVYGSYEVDINPEEPIKHIFFTYRFADLTCQFGLNGQPGFCNAAAKHTFEGRTIPRARIRMFVENPTVRPGP